jgi:hypothetical protein
VQVCHRCCDVGGPSQGICVAVAAGVGLGHNLGHMLLQGATLQEGQGWMRILVSQCVHHNSRGIMLTGTRTQLRTRHVCAAVTSFFPSIAGLDQIWCCAVFQASHNRARRHGTWGPLSACCTAGAQQHHTLPPAAAPAAGPSSHPACPACSCWCCPLTRRPWGCA